MKRTGFTMIELIFVIVILGILAAVAIPKLAATRSDAKISSELTSVAQAIQNLGAEFTAKGSFTNYTVANANAAVKCFRFVEESSTDGNVSLALIAAATTNGTCDADIYQTISDRASVAGIVDANSSTKTYYVFGGTSVVY